MLPLINDESAITEIRSTLTELISAEQNNDKLVSNVFEAPETLEVNLSKRKFQLFFMAWQIKVSLVHSSVTAVYSTLFQ